MSGTGIRASPPRPLYISNDDVRRVAADVRGQLVFATDAHRLTRDHLRAIGTIQANGVRLGVCWSTDYPVTNEQDEAVLGVCEYDHRGMPDTALISVKPDLTRDNDGLLLGTLAHELGHAIFDVPAWRTVSCQNTLARTSRRADPPCLSCGDNRRGASNQFDLRGWRAGLRGVAGQRVHGLTAGAARPPVRPPAAPCPGDRHSVGKKSGAGLAGVRGSSFSPHQRRRPTVRLAISILLHRLAEDFGVSLKFIQVGSGARGPAGQDERKDG
jgi:hypothetical protein